MLKIDTHAHYLPRDWPDLARKYGELRFPVIHHTEDGRHRIYKDGKFFREIWSKTWDPQERIDDYAKFDVQVQVLSTVPVMFCYWARPHHALELHQALNDHMAQTCRDYPRHYAGIGTVPLQSPRHGADAGVMPRVVAAGLRHVVVERLVQLQRVVRPCPVAEHHRYRAQHLDLHAVARVVVDALLRVPGLGPDLAEELAVLVDAVPAILGVVDHREAVLAVLARQVGPVARQVVGMGVDFQHRASLSAGVRCRA